MRLNSRGYLMLGMAIESFVVGVLTVTHWIDPTGTQQISAGAMLLVFAFTVGARR